MRQFFPNIKRSLLLLFLATHSAFSQNLSVDGKIEPKLTFVHISNEGIPYANAESDGGVYRIDWGRFDSPCPPMKDENDDCRRPGMEPNASYSTLYYVDARGGGILTFKYRYQSYGKVKTDTAMISLIDPAYTLHTIESSLSSPHGQRGIYWDSGTQEVSFDLNPWKYQDNAPLYLQFSFSTDGYGDQSKLSIWNLEVIGCDVVPLTPITDEDALLFENGQTINIEKLNTSTQNGLTCMQQAVRDLGGTFVLSSAYRPLSYQSHLRDIWDRSTALKDSVQPLAYCTSLMIEVDSELNKHNLIAQPAEPLPSAPHSMGNAFDATIKALPSPHTVDTVAENCGMYRRMPIKDPVHYEPKPGFLEFLWRQFHD